MSSDVQMIPSRQLGVVFLANGINGKQNPIFLAKQLLAALQVADAAGTTTPASKHKRHDKHP